VFAADDGTAQRQSTDSLGGLEGDLYASHARRCAAHKHAMPWQGFIWQPQDCGWYQNTHSSSLCCTSLMAAMSKSGTASPHHQALCGNLLFGANISGIHRTDTCKLRLLLLQVSCWTPASPWHATPSASSTAQPCRWAEHPGCAGPQAAAAATHWLSEAATAQDTAAPATQRQA
jgi:hypothetical protein